MEKEILEGCRNIAGHLLKVARENLLTHGNLVPAGFVIEYPRKFHLVPHIETKMSASQMVYVLHELTKKIGAPAFVYISEAWVSMADTEKAAKEKIPSKDPDRKEAILLTLGWADDTPPEFRTVFLGRDASGDVSCFLEDDAINGSENVGRMFSSAQGIFPS